MKEVYAISLFLLLIFINIYVQRARAEQSPLAKALINLTIAVTVGVASSMLAGLLPNETAALFFRCVHYAGTEWILIYALFFLEEYVGVVESTRMTQRICGMAAGLNTIQIMLNPFFGHFVSCEYDRIGDDVYRMFVEYSPWYELHQYYSYFLALCCLLIMLKATVTTISFYRGKYVPALIAFMLTIATEIICTLYNTHLDYALYGYVCLDIFLIYHSVYHVQKEMITSTLSLVTADSNSGVVCFDIDEKCIYINDEMRRLYPDTVTGAEFKEIFAKQVYDSRFEFMDDQRWELELDGEEGKIYLEVNFRKLFDKREDYIGCYFYLYDKTVDVTKLRQEQFRASHDELTGLDNRKHFSEVVSVMTRDGKKDYYLIAADVKDFKLINDLFGFAHGNMILKEYAKLIKEYATEKSACCRMNSDRFAFCIPADLFSEEKLSEITQKVSELVESKQYQLHIHYGVYKIAPEEKNVSVMYDHARMALHLIKDDYQRAFAYYDENMMNKTLREKQLLGEFEQALLDKQFLMYLQPQVATDGTVLGAEALVRWEHPELGMISPGEFIPTFENAGVIHELDCYMWEMAAQKLKEWKTQGKENYHISVNISTKDFYYVDIYKTVTDLVEKYEINPEKLKLEITESAFMADQDKQLALIAKLQDYGFHVEIDDFGSGYSSLNMLKDMKADVLKIDMGFLRKTQQESRAKVILDMIVGLAKRLEMVVITEGVETKEQAEYLTDVGCDIFQGFYFDRPIPVAQFEEKYM